MVKSEEFDIREKLKQLNMTQQDLALALGCSISTVAKWCSGLNSPTPATVVGIKSLKPLVKQSRFGKFKEEPYEFRLYNKLGMAKITIHSKDIYVLKIMENFLDLLEDGDILKNAKGEVTNDYTQNQIDDMRKIRNENIIRKAGK